MNRAGSDEGYTDPGAVQLELSYADIAAGVGLPNGHRLRRAVRLVRVIAANRGDRLERFMPSADPAQRRVFVTPLQRNGHGDEFSARDAMSAARAAMTSVKDMHRATTFEAANPHSMARKEFATMAHAADECIIKKAGLDTVAEQAGRRENTPSGKSPKRCVKRPEGETCTSPRPKNNQSGHDADNNPSRYSSEDRQPCHEPLGEGGLVQRFSVRLDGEELIRDGRLEQVAIL
ncbi:hypothetical protein ABZ897_59700 [Nonomuraea sp. NPDC046802]|uniref:hypothetical protein n=1 Tax=Nonomuraea sp. NPDC046802 TaxID=3154919 RepID=UPI003409BB8A